MSVSAALILIIGASPRAGLYYAGHLLDHGHSMIVTHCCENESLAEALPVHLES